VERDERVLIDFRTADDAGVYRWEGGPALVQTVDFFTPIVDDPYQYGQIAAANSLSDVYAMGGRPVTALAIAGFPKDEVDAQTIREVFRGGFDKLREASVALLGGHTVQDREIKFGYAVTGAVDPSRILSNAGARPGDALLLTKPIGTGIIGTAIKFDRLPAGMLKPAVEQMATLNRAAAEALAPLIGSGVHGCTDITGFGLLGHLSEMAAASFVTARLDSAAVPMIAGVRALVSENRSGGVASNRTYFSRGLRMEGTVDPDLLDLLYDPQTSGGLLVAVAAASVDDLTARLTDAGVTVARIGDVLPRNSTTLVEVH
jgi:selenide,water dikinase